MFVVALAIPGCGEPPEDPNVTAFKAAIEAERASNFRDARNCLSNVVSVSDKDLQELIAYQLRLCAFCIEAGIPRDTKSDVTTVSGIKSLLSEIDYKTLLASLIKNGVDDAPNAAKRLANEGAALLAGLHDYSEVREVVRKRYLR